MVGTLNRVSTLFRDITSRHLPKIYINPSLAEMFGIEGYLTSELSMMKINKQAGRGSGLGMQVRKLFSGNKRWMWAWLTLVHVMHGHYLVKDIYWK